MPSCADHLDQIMAVMESAFDPAFGEAWNRRQVDDALVMGNCHYGLALRDGACAGFFLSRFTVDEEELLLLAVKPQYRSQGIGRKLLVDFVDQARARGALRLFLEMRQGNPAKKLYESMGFTQVGLRPNYYRTLSGARIDALSYARLT